MTVSLDERMRRLSPERRARIEVCTETLIKYELGRQDLSQEGQPVEHRRKAEGEVRSR